MRIGLLGISILLVAGCLGGAPGPGPDPTVSSTAPFVCANAKSFRPANVTVAIETSKGTIQAVLFGSRAPITVCNFLRYVEEDFYDHTIFHRICPHVIQAGGFDPYVPPDGRQKPTHDPIRNEANVSQLRNLPGALGMARDSQPDSATAHFYINNRDNTYLDWDGRYAPGYAVFGNVTAGWDVEQAIAATPTVPEPPNQCSGGTPLPSQQTTILDIRVLGSAAT